MNENGFTPVPPAGGQNPAQGNYQPTVVVGDDTQRTPNDDRAQLVVVTPSRHTKFMKKFCFYGHHN